MSTTPASSSTVTDIGHLVQLYRTGLLPVAQQAATELLSRFDRYLQKWVRLLLYGKWDHKDKEIRHFLQMLGSVDIEKTAQILCLRLKAYEREDLEQEVRVAFLNTCRSSNSIRKHFRYTLQRRVVILLKDPLVYNQENNIPLRDEEDPIYRAPEIDDAWVAGYTCGPGFDELTVEERRILQLCKYYGFSIEHAASVMGKSTATISRAISRAKRVLSIHYLG